jgi:hypothetical protein
MSDYRIGTAGVIWRVVLLGLFCFNLACSKGDKESVEDETKTADTAKSQVVQAYGKLPLSFTENRGQMAELVRFYIRGPRGTVYYTPEEVVYDVVEKTAEPKRTKLPEERDEIVPSDTTFRRKGVVVRMRFLGANSSVALEGIDELEGKVNIFRGKDPSQWKTGIRTFRGIIYRDLYPGVDLMYHGQDGRLTHRLTIKPEGEVRDVVFRYEGADEIEVDTSGNLRIKTALGTITELKPHLYQEKAGKKITVEGGYRTLGKDAVGFSAKKYKGNLPLIISMGADQ